MVISLRRVSSLLTRKTRLECPSSETERCDCCWADSRGWFKEHERGQYAICCTAIYRKLGCSTIRDRRLNFKPIWVKSTSLRRILVEKWLSLPIRVLVAGCSISIVRIMVSVWFYLFISRLRVSDWNWDRADRFWVVHKLFKAFS